MLRERFHESSKFPEECGFLHLKKVTYRRSYGFCQMKVASWINSTKVMGVLALLIFLSLVAMLATGSTSKHLVPGST
jgi:hypothetical protein